MCRAFGYNQVLGSGRGVLKGAAPPPHQAGGGARGSAVPQQPTHAAAWNSSALVEDPGKEEIRILEQVSVDGGGRELV